MSALRRPVLHLDVSTPQGTEVHLDLSEQQELMCSGKLHVLLKIESHKNSYKQKDNC